MERTLQNKESEILKMTEVTGSLEHRLKMAEDSVTKWRVKYLNIEANHLNLKKNLATGRGPHVVTPIHDIIPIPPDVNTKHPEDDEESMHAISYVIRANERNFKDSPYKQALQPTFMTELSPRDASRKKGKSRKHGSNASSSAPSNSREPLPKLREKSKRHLKESVRRAYGLSTTEEAERSSRVGRGSHKAYPTLPPITSKRK